MRSSLMSNPLVRKKKSVFNRIVKQHFSCLLIGDRESSYESFLEKLKIVNGSEKECRYGLFDFEYTHQCQGTQEVRKLPLSLMSVN